MSDTIRIQGRAKSLEQAFGVVFAVALVDGNEGILVSNCDISANLVSRSGYWELTVSSQF